MRLVEERPCKVNGKSRSNWASDGASKCWAGVVGSGEGSFDVSRVEARRDILSRDGGRRTGSGSSGFGTLDSPLREKASLYTGASELCWRDGGCGRVSRVDGMGSGSEAESRYKKYRMAHF